MLWNVILLTLTYFKISHLSKKNSDFARVIFILLWWEILCRAKLFLLLQLYHGLQTKWTFPIMNFPFHGSAGLSHTVSPESHVKPSPIDHIHAVGNPTMHWNLHCLHGVSPLRDVGTRQHLVIKANWNLSTASNPLPSALIAKWPVSVSKTVTTRINGAASTGALISCWFPSWMLAGNESAVLTEIVKWFTGKLLQSYEGDEIDIAK